jgi:hypothetical protein
LRGSARFPRLAPAQKARLLGPFGFTANATLDQPAFDRNRLKAKKLIDQDQSLGRNALICFSLSANTSHGLAFTVCMFALLVGRLARLIRTAISPGDLANRRSWRQKKYLHIYL